MFCIPHVFWWFGLLVFIPLVWLLGLYNFAMAVYGLGFLIFDDSDTLQFDEWLLYPVRRYIVEGIIMTLGTLSIVFLPFISWIISPLLGFWYLQDYLDYTGWDQMISTLGIPFTDYDYFDTSTHAKGDSHSPDGHSHTIYDHTHDSNNNVYYN